jgi:hypothetical protein
MFVPGNGQIGTAHDVVAFREYLLTLRQLVPHTQRAGRSNQEVMTAVMPTLAETYATWDLFAAVARQNTLDVDSELRGTKRIPRP